MNKISELKNYTNQILKFLNIEVSSFTRNYKNGDQYELQIKVWIDELYDRNLNVQEASNEIQKKRLELLIAQPDPFDILESIENSLEKTKKLLYINSEFKEFKSINEIEVNMLIRKFTFTKLYTSQEIVKFIINILKNRNRKESTIWIRNFDQFINQRNNLLKAI